jgi:hypothetical protein
MKACGHVDVNTISTVWAHTRGLQEDIHRRLTAITSSHSETDKSIEAQVLRKMAVLKMSLENEGCGVLDEGLESQFPEEPEVKPEEESTEQWLHRYHRGQSLRKKMCPGRLLFVWDHHNRKPYVRCE